MVTCDCCAGDPDALRGGGRVLRVLGSAVRPEHLVPLQPGAGVRLGGLHWGVARAAPGLRVLMLQPHHVLLHEPQVPPGVPRCLQLRQRLPRPSRRAGVTRRPHAHPLAALGPVPQRLHGVRGLCARLCDRCTHWWICRGDGTKRHQDAGAGGRGSCLAASRPGADPLCSARRSPRLPWSRPRWIATSPASASGSRGGPAGTSSSRWGWTPTRCHSAAPAPATCTRSARDPQRTPDSPRLSASRGTHPASYGIVRTFLHLRRLEDVADEESLLCLSDFLFHPTGDLTVKEAR